MRLPLTAGAVAIAGFLVAGGVLVGLQLRDDPSDRGSAAPVDVTTTAGETEATTGQDDGATETSHGDAEADAPLSFFEEKLVGGWSRYHSYDGSTQYAIFNADRTVCKWERTASGSVRNDYSYGFWQLSTAKNPNGTYTIYYGDTPDDRTLYYTFDYAADEVLLGVDVVASRDPDLLECFS